MKAKTNRFLFVIFLFGASLNFLPFFLGYSLKDPNTDQYPSFLVSLSGFEYCSSIVASLATLIPIFLDLVLDIISGNFLKEVKLLPSLNLPFREIVVMLIASDILLLFWIIPYAQYDLVAPLICSRDTMFTFFYLSILAKFQNQLIWNDWTTIAIGGPLMIANVLLSCAVFFSADFLQTVNEGIVPTLISLGLFILVLTILRWFFFRQSTIFASKICSDSHDSLEMMNDAHNSEQRKANLLCSVYGVFLGIFLFGDWILFYIPLPISSPWSLVGCNYLTMYSYLMVGCTLCITVVTNHIARTDAVDARV